MDELANQLFSFAAKHGEGSFSFQNYAGIPAAHSPRRSIIHFLPMLQVLMNVKATLDIKFSELKSAAKLVFARNPYLMKKVEPGFTVEDCACTMADRLMVLQNHCRWLSRDNHTCSRVLATMTPQQQQEMVAFLDTISPAPGQASGIVGSSSSSLAQGSSSTRTLACQISDVTCDSDGLPALTGVFGEDGGEGSAGPLPVLDTASIDSPLPPTKALIKEQWDTMANVSKKPAASPQITMKKPAATLKPDKAQLDEKVSYENLKLQGPFTKQSYIVTKTRKLMVCCSTNQSEEHYTVLSKVLALAKANGGASKAEMILWRNQMLGLKK